MVGMFSVLTKLSSSVVLGMTSPYQLTSEHRCALGEGPMWHADQQQLYVTDAFEGIVSIFNPMLQVIRQLRFGRTTTAMTVQADGSLLFFHDRGSITHLTLSDERRCLMESIPDEERGLFNDVIADPVGRILAGAQPVGERPGRLYCIEPDLSYRILLDDIQEPNGLGFSPDQSTLYFTDSGSQTIWRFAYDKRMGTLSDKEVFLKTSDDVLPDGLTVDAEGFVWSALWNGGAVVRISPGGQILSTIPLPAQRPTSVIFGGPALDTLYVTSAKNGVDARFTTPPSASDGAVFGIRTLFRGRPEFPSRLLG